MENTSINMGSRWGIVTCHSWKEGKTRYFDPSPWSIMHWILKVCLDHRNPHANKDAADLWKKRYGNPHTSESSIYIVCKVLGVGFDFGVLPSADNRKTSRCRIIHHVMLVFAALFHTAYICGCWKQNSKQCRAIIDCARHAISPFTYKEDQWTSWSTCPLLLPSWIQVLCAQQSPSDFHCIST